MIEGGNEMLIVVFMLCILFMFLSAHTALATMIPERFTDRARVIINYANEEARKLKHSYIGTEHLLLGLIYERGGIAARAIQELGVSLEKLEAEVKKVMEKSDIQVEENQKHMAFTRAADQAIQYAMEEAQKLEYDHVGTEHILLGLLRVKDGMAAEALNNSEITINKVRRVLKPISSSKRAPKLDAVQDGSIDATESIQQELDKAGKTGGEVFLVAGRYRLNGHLTIPPGVTLRGSWKAPHHACLNTGTVLLAYEGRGDENEMPLITLSPSSAIRGLTIYYPEQNIDDVQPYPWTIQGSGMHNSVIDVTLVNPYNGIDIGSSHNELHYLRNIYGCPLKRGIYINNCTDIGRIENVHFNPHYWARDEGDGEPRPDGGKLIEYLLREGEAFIFGRTDWEYVLNTFCYGYNMGYHFVGTEQGACNGNFLGIGADGTKNAVVVEKAAPYGLLITNGEFVSMRADDPVEIIVGPENRGALQLNNCAFWGPANQIARIQGSGTVSFVQCNFVYWDHAKKNLPAIELNGGKLIVQNCNFQRPGKQILLGSESKSAVIFGNQIKGEINIENQSGGDTQIGFNATY
jgi:hypothetical protein